MGLKYEILNPKQIRNHKYQIYEEIRFENPARRVSVVVELARQFDYPAVFFLQSELCHYECIFMCLCDHRTALCMRDFLVLSLYYLFFRPTPYALRFSLPTILEH